MPEAPEPLLLDLLETLRAGPRPYAETQEAWRTSCPRLPVWEDALDSRLIARRAVAGEPATVALTADGERFLGARRG
ncbi:hypothetical protein ACE7GA_06960 [Roseomonas sp. CCTCC AB2023176]|uniref:hypothetical protein n=1 Tax=Roseomonas sp. CCTCC AB2023176 TaxID=3342640 RepID=UPI0035E2E7D3